MTFSIQEEVSKHFTSFEVKLLPDLRWARRADEDELQQLCEVIEYRHGQIHSTKHEWRMVPIIADPQP